MYQRKKYYNCIIAVAMVVFCFFNVSTQMAENAALSGFDGKLCVFTAALAAPALPLMISGIGGRFLDNSLDLSLRTIICNYLPKAALSALCWWIAIALLFMRMEYPTELDVDTFFDCLSVVLENPYCVRFYQLCFVMVLFYPLLKKAANSAKAMQYTLLVSFGLCVVNPLLEMVPYVRYITLFTNQINWHFFSAYTFYLFLGMYLRKREIPGYWRAVIYCAGVLSAIAMYMFTVVADANLKGFTDEWMSDASVFVAVQTFSILVFVKAIVARKKEKTSTGTLLREVGGYGYAFIAFYTASDIVTSQGLMLENYAVPAALIMKTLICLCFCIVMGYGAKRLPILSYISTDPGDNVL